MAQLLTTVSGVTAQYRSRPRVPGVAFQLTPDYSTAVIHLKDGTTVPIARVQGSPKYQAFMRKGNTSTSSGDSPLCQWVIPSLGALPFGRRTDICRSADVVTVKALMVSLNAAVESYLVTNICFAALLLDDVEGHKPDVAQEALQALGRHQVLSLSGTGKSEMLLLLFNTPLEVYEKPRIVLAVDYSFHWFNVGLYTVDEVGIVDSIQSTVGEPDVGNQNQPEALRAALQYPIASPPPGVAIPTNIPRLVIYGDDAKNDNVLHILATVLGVELIEPAQFAQSVYDGVAYVAKEAHVHINTVEFEMREPASFGCRWRSRLYSEEQTEV